MLDYDNLCLCCGTIAQASFREVVESAAAGGFRSISLWPQHYNRGRRDGLSDAGMRSMLEHHGLVVTELDALLTWLPGSRPATEADTSGEGFVSVGEDFFYHIADSLGGRHLNLAQAFGPRLETDVLAEAFAGVCDRAAEHGLLVTLEFLPWSGIPDMETALQIVRRADRPNGGVMLDTWHHFRSGHGAEALMKVPGAEIKAIQFNDAAAEPAQDIVNETMHGRLLPGEGAIDLVGILQALDASGCQAPIGVEVFSDDLNALTPTMAAVRAGDAARAVLARARR